MLAVNDFKEGYDITRKQEETTRFKTKYRTMMSTRCPNRSQNVVKDIGTQVAILTECVG